MLTTVRTANRAVRFAHKPNCRQPARFGSPHEPHRDTMVQFVGGANRHGSSWFTTVRQTAAAYCSFSSFTIFFHALLTLSHNKSVFHLAVHMRKLFSLTVALLPLSVFFSQARRLQKDHTFTPSLYSPTPTLPSILVFDHIFPVFAPSQYSTIVFLQLSLTLRIRRSRFGNFCTVAAFDSRS